MSQLIVNELQTQIIQAASLTASGIVQASSFVGAGIIPTGSVMPFAGTTEPAGWLFCAGQGLGTTTYAALFAVIGYTYGGSGTTFILPDMRGRVAAGRDNMGGTSASRLAAIIAGGTLGAAGGADTHTMSIAEMPLHGHPYRASYAQQGGAQSSTTGGFMHFTSAVSTQGPYTGVPSNTQGQGIGGEGGGGAHNNLQPTIVLNYIIKT
jgi:microcystin-dependent protein